MADQERHSLEQWAEIELLLIGGSAGSFKIISDLLKLLNKPIRTSWVIIMHRGKSYIDIEKVFSGTNNVIKEITDKDTLQPGVIYIAPADYHVLFEHDGCLSLDVSEQVHYSRPSIDVAFESAADVYGKRCAAVLLSGANEDGAKGMRQLQKKGALTIAQDPTDAEISTMPQAAVNLHAANLILTKESIIKLLMDKC